MDEGEQVSKRSHRRTQPASCSHRDPPARIHPAQATLPFVHHSLTAVCYTEKAPHAWHRRGTQKTASQLRFQTQTSNLPTADTGERALGSANTSTPAPARSLCCGPIPRCDNVDCDSTLCAPTRALGCVYGTHDRRVEQLQNHPNLSPLNRVPPSSFGAAWAR